MMEKFLVVMVMIGAWMFIRVNAGSMEVVSSHTMLYKGPDGKASEDVDIVLNQWPVWNKQKQAEKLVAAYLSNSLPGIVFTEIADTLTIHVYLTMRDKKRNRIYYTIQYE